MIYLDHTATRLIDPEIIAVYAKLLAEANFNPAARYAPALEVKDKIKEAKKRLQEALGAQSFEPLVSSGATESINLALLGLADAYPQRAKRILTTDLEHSATRSALEKLAGRGYDIVTIPCRDGFIDLSALDEALLEPALALTLIHVQNEIGTVVNLEDAVALARARQKQILIHLDAVQAVTKIPFRADGLGVDLISLSGHKFGAPKGIGFLLVAPKVKLVAQIVGGGQQSGLRSGTENYPLLETSVQALERALTDLDQKSHFVLELREALVHALHDAGLDFHVLSGARQIPQILALEIPALRGETIMHALSELGICVSIGSACSSHKGSHDSLYRLYGLSRERARHVIRISINESNTMSEMEYLVQSLVKVVNMYKI